MRPNFEGQVMERFLICKNPLCHFVIDLRTKENQVVQLSDLIINQCPDCGREWSSRCPFCLQTLDVMWRETSPICSHCLKALKPDHPELEHK
jgi:hypothetical protein